MMYHFISLYMALTMLVIIPVLRGIAVAREFGCYPNLQQLIFGEKLLSKSGSKYVRLGITASVMLALLIFMGWKTGSIASDIERGGISIFWGMSVTSFAAISFGLRSIYYNVTIRTDSMSVKEENRAFNEIALFPGFSNLPKSLITTTMALAFVCSALTIITRSNL